MRIRLITQHRCFRPVGFSSAIWHGLTFSMLNHEHKIKHHSKVVATQPMDKSTKRISLVNKTPILASIAKKEQKPSVTLFTAFSNADAVGLQIK